MLRLAIGALAFLQVVRAHRGGELEAAPVEPHHGAAPHTAESVHLDAAELVTAHTFLHGAAQNGSDSWSSHGALQASHQAAPASRHSGRPDLVAAPTLSEGARWFRTDPSLLEKPSYKPFSARVEDDHTIIFVSGGGQDIAVFQSHDNLHELGAQIRPAEKKETHVLGKYHPTINTLYHPLTGARSHGGTDQLLALARHFQDIDDGRGGPFSYPVWECIGILSHNAPGGTTSSGPADRGKIAEQVQEIEGSLQHYSLQISLSGYPTSFSVVLWKGGPWPRGEPVTRNVVFKFTASDPTAPNA